MPTYKGFVLTRWKIPLHVPTFGAEEIAAAVKVLKSTRVTMGEEVRAFEKLWEKRLERPCVMVNSGSSANLLMFAILTSPLNRVLQPQDEVLVPCLCWSTTVWPIVQHGLIPVFVDISPKTLNMETDFHRLEEAVGPRTKAIFPVHVYGNPCDRMTLRSVAAKYDLTLLEDCCEAIEGSVGGYKVGTWGRMASFSFYFSHQMTTLEGGMLVCEKQEDADLARVLRAHGWTREIEWDEKTPDWMDPRFTFIHTGYNLRPTELQAAIGRVQMRKLPAMLEQRRKVAEAMKKHFAPSTVQQAEPAAYRTWFGFPILAGGLEHRTALVKRLQHAGVETRPLIAGDMSQQPGMKLYQHRISHRQEAERIARRGFSIGCHQGMTVAQGERLGRLVETNW